MPHKLPIGIALLGLVIGGVALYAQSAPDDLGTTPDISVPMSKDAQLSPAEMTEKTGELIGQAMADRKRISQLRSEARKKKDVLKLNCVNDKLLQVRQLMGILDDAKTKLTIAISTGDEAERYHRFSMITIAREKVQALRDEAEGCIGEEIAYLGPLDVNVDQPEIPDDPTKGGPFDGDEIDPPGYASPFE